MGRVSAHRCSSYLKSPITNLWYVENEHDFIIENGISDLLDAWL